MLAVAISLATVAAIAGKAVGVDTLDAWGHLMITTDGLSTGSTNSTLIMSELIWPEANTLDRTMITFL